MKDEHEIKISVVTLRLGVREEGIQRCILYQGTPVGIFFAYSFLPNGFLKRAYKNKPVFENGYFINPFLQNYLSKKPVFGKRFLEKGIFKKQVSNKINFYNITLHNLT